MAIRAVVVLMGLVVSLAAAPRGLPAAVDGKVYVVGTSHLDTQWWWTIEDTIRDLLPVTFSANFALLDRYPGFHFSFEGAFRYMLLEEYYPDLWDELQVHVAAGRWLPAGSSVEAGDVIVPSPESLLRHFLYGNGFFRDALGVMSNDVFLPDCFGFPWSLPSVAAHCGLRGFSTAKLDWGSALPVPFDVGLWEGPDGASLVAALRPGAYNRELPGDPAALPETLAAMDRQEALSGLRFRYLYFGVGDQGGGLPEATVATVQESLAGEGEPGVVSASSGQMFDELTAAERAALPVHRGELLMRVHGTGTYTAQAAMKRWNRRNELLADAAERASVVAAWLGGRDYPAAALRADWIRFLWHQFHDDLTGTSIPQAYSFSWNDELLTQSRFAGVLTGAVGTVARALDTRVDGTPVVVFNPLSRARQDVVDLVLPRLGDASSLRVFGPDGVEVPSQLRPGTDAGTLEVAFLASLPSVGFAVYDLRPSEAPCALATGLSVSERALENARYRVELDDNGDVARVYDGVEGRELLAAPLRVEIFRNLSIDWPAWEILYSDLVQGPQKVLAGPAQIRVVESGPVRACLEVTRAVSGSTFVQRTCLSAGEAGERVEMDLDIDWASLVSLAKLAFPLAVADDEATYDLGLGTIRRPVNREELYEVPAQQWVDLTDRDGSYGVSLATDCKYGWDRPDESTLRLTLLHTPFWPSFDQHTMDLGPHRMRLAMTGHRGDWRNGAADAAARVNQPLAAFVTTEHPGPLGTSWSFASVDRDSVDIRAVKADEADAGMVVLRLQELDGAGADGLRLRVGDGIVEARRLDGMERDLGPLVVVDGQARLDLGAYGIATVGLRLSPPASALAPPNARTVALPWDTDVVSSDGDWRDGDFDGEGRSFAAELWPANLSHGGIPYRLGPTGPGEANAVTCAGQALDLGQPLAEGERLYLLVAATEELAASFTAGEARFDLAVPAWSGFIGQWVDRMGADGQVLQDLAAFKPPFHRPDPVAWYGSHRHGPAGNEPYRFTYLFRKVLEAPPGTSQVILPEDPRLRVLALTVAAEPADDTRPASVLYDGHDPAVATGIHVGSVEAPPPAPADVSGGDSAPDTGPVARAGGCAMGPAAAPAGGPWAALLAAAGLLLAWRRRRAVPRARSQRAPRCGAFRAAAREAERPTARKAQSVFPVRSGSDAAI